MFIVAGTALVTMLVDLNAAVISFTLFFHLVRLKWELPDMRLDDPEEGTEALVAFHVGERVRLRGNRQLGAPLCPLCQHLASIDNDVLAAVGDHLVNRDPTNLPSVLCTVGVIQSYDPVTGLFTMRQEHAPGSSVSSGALAEPSDGAAAGAAESGGEAAALAQSVEVEKVSQTEAASLPLP